MLLTSLRHVRSGCKLLGVLGVGLGAIVLVLLLVLANGPISLGFLTGPLEDVLSDEKGRFSVHIDDTSIAWAGWKRNVDLRAVGIRVKDPAGNDVVKLPSIAISLSGRAMLRKTLAVKSVDLFGLSLTIRRMPDGKISIGVDSEGDSGDNLKPLMEYLSVLEEAPHSGSPLSYLERIRIIDANLGFVDLATSRGGRAPKAGLVLRREGGRLRVGLRADFHVEGRVFQTATVIRHDVESNMFRFASNLRSNDLPFFLGLLMPVPAANGKPPEGNKAPKSHLVTGKIQGNFAPESGLITLSTLEFMTKGPTPLAIPVADDLILPLRRISGSASFDMTDGKAKVENLELDLGGPKAYLTAEATNLGGEPEISGHAALTEFNFDLVRRLWPGFVTPKARKWVMEHVRAGFVPKLQARWRIVLAKPKIRVESIEGDFEVSGVELDYFANLPVLNEGVALAKFDRSQLAFQVKGGRSDSGITLKGGSVVISKPMPEDPTRIGIDLDLEGPLGAGIDVISKEPLNLTKRFNVDPRNIKGKLAVALKLAFTVGDKNWRKNISYSVGAHASQVSWKRPTWPRNVNKGNLTVKANNGNIDLNGHFRIKTLPIDISWSRTKDDKNDWKNRIVARGEVSTANFAKDLDLKSPLFAPPFLDGSLGMSMVYESVGGKEEPFVVSADLTSSNVWFPMIDWRKGAGTRATAQVSLLPAGRGGVKVPSFSFTSKGLKLSGALGFAKDGKTVSEVDIKRLSQGRNDLAIRARKKSGDRWQVDLTGKSLDLRPLRKGLTGGSGGGGSMPPVTASLNMGTVWFRLGHGLANVQGNMEFDGQLWRSIALSGILKSGKSASLAISPLDRKQRSLEIKSDDAGAALRAFDIYDNMVGGNLALRGAFDDSTTETVLNGKLNIKKFRVVKAPVLAKLLSVASLTGILESLSGKGLAFEQLEAPFQVRGSEIFLNDGQAYGASIGITASGSVDKSRNSVNIHGTIAPAYLINQIPGKIPLIGEIFSGGEKGSGLFAANYKVTGQLSQPDVLVNPLSALAPGFLRNLFKIGSP